MKYKFGSNYVPDKIKFSMNEEDKNKKFIGIIYDDVDYSGNMIQEYN